MKNQRKPEKKSNRIEHYLSLPYTVLVRQNEDGTFFAEIEELPGCMTEADNIEQLLDMIKDAQRTWIQAALARGLPIPEPRSQEEFSGRFLVRIPKSLHRNLVRKAQKEGVSLNQLATMALAQIVQE